MDLFYILKLNTSDIVENKYFIQTSFNKSKNENNIIALGDNQLLKFIRKLKEENFNKEYISNLYSKRNKLKQMNDENKNSKKIIDIQNEINEILFVPEIISIKVDTSKKDYKYICKNGFKVSIIINNKNFEFKYKRLCAGAGQLRRNSSLFVCEELYDRLEQIMMCGLSKNRIGKINLAKFSAYFALYTSATRQVKKPNICVIKDLEYKLLNQKISWIYDKENGDRDIENRTMDFDYNAFDGSGMISVEMSKKWAEDLSLDYLPSSYIIRSAWIKGLVSTFDFKKFAKEIAKTDTIKDAWGETYSIKDIDVILTTSQFKMYKKYESWQEYLYYHTRYGHIFGIARVNKKENNFLTPLNYQYIQTNEFTIDSIKEMSNFSIDWIKKIMTCDKLYTMLFLLGTNVSEENYSTVENSLNSYIAKSLMYNDEILNDNYIRNKISQMINKKINQLKIGKLLVEGSYDFAIPDLYAMAEHAFGMNVKGILPEGYSWNKRWVKKGSKIVSSQRSPLVAPSENQLRKICYDDKCDDWFKYIDSGMIMSIWDACMIAESDADYDGGICRL